MPEPNQRARVDRELSQSLLAVVVLIALALTAWAVAGLAPTISDTVGAAFDRGSSAPDGHARVTIRSGDYVAFVVLGAADLEPWLEKLMGTPISRLPELSGRASHHLNRKLVFSPDLGDDPDDRADAQAVESKLAAKTVASSHPTGMSSSGAITGAASGSSGDKRFLGTVALRLKSSVTRSPRRRRGLWSPTAMGPLSLLCLSAAMSCARSGSFLLRTMCTSAPVLR